MYERRTREHGVINTLKLNLKLNRTACVCLSVGRSVTADAGGNVTKLDLSGTTSKLESKCLLIEPHYTSDLCCASQASLAPLEDAQV